MYMWFLKLTGVNVRLIQIWGGIYAISKLVEFFGSYDKPVKAYEFTIYSQQLKYSTPKIYWYANCLLTCYINLFW